MSELSQIKDIVNQYPKLFSQVIQRNEELLKFVIANTSHLAEVSPTLSERIYHLLNQANATCEQGNRRRFISFNSGYGYCGKTSHCECAKKSIGDKVSAVARNRSEKRKKEINETRLNTVREKYGELTVLQTEKAKTAHARFYSNTDLVTQAVQKTQDTKLERYGNKFYNNSEKIKATWAVVAEKYFSEEKHLILRDPLKMKELYDSHTVEEIAEKLVVHPQTVYKWTAIHVLRKIYRSSFEDEIVKFLHDLGVSNITRNTRKLIPNSKEIDIFLPDYNLAIEYNGVYWHNDKLEKIHRLYHYNKVVECRKKNIDLLTIFSHHWETKKDVIKAHIRHRLKMNVSNKIYARNTSSCVIDYKEAKSFLDQHHVQGFVKAEHYLGLKTKEGDLVAVMTFSKSKSRKLNAKTAQNDSHELVRYASSCAVIGGASKLLSYFIKSNHPACIISYSDNMYSSGNLYKSLGFELASETVSYFYVDPSSLRHIHRYTLNKKKLVAKGADASKTERQITSELGYLRVPDCGICKWVLNVR